MIHKISSPKAFWSNLVHSLDFLQGVCRQGTLRGNPQHPDPVQEKSLYTDYTSQHTVFWKCKTHHCFPAFVVTLRKKKKDPSVYKFISEEHKHDTQACLFSLVQRRSFKINRTQSPRRLLIDKANAFTAEKNCQVERLRTYFWVIIDGYVIMRTRWSTNVENAVREKVLIYPIDNYDLYASAELSRNYKYAKPEHFGRKKNYFPQVNIFFFQNKNLGVQSAKCVGAWDAGF